MKHVYILIFTTLILSLNLSAQVTISPAAKAKNNSNLDTYFKSYDLLKINDSKSLFLIGDELDISVKLKNNTSLNVQAYQNDVLSNHAQLQMITAQGMLTKPTTSVKTFTGVTANGEDSRLTVATNFFYLQAKVGKKSIIIESLQRYEKSAGSDDLIIYEPQDVIQPAQHICGKSAPGHLTKSDIISPASAEKSMGCREVDMTIAIDFALYQKHIENYENCLAEAAAIMNAVNGDYQDFNGTEVSFKITNFIVSVCSDCDLWGFSSEIGNLLINFGLWSNSSSAVGTYDLIGLFSGNSFSGNFSGLANKDQLCEAFGQFVARHVGFNIQTFRALTSHEIGHVFGCEHNYEFGSICEILNNRDPLLMDPVVSASVTDWSDGSQNCALDSKTTITTAAQKPCISTCSAGSCAAATDLNTVFTGTNSMQITWSGTASSYILSIQNEATGAYILNTPATGTMYNFIGAIDNCDNYLLSLTSNCGTTNGPSISQIIQTNNSTKMTISDIEVANCVQGSPSTYDMELTVTHNGGNGSGFEVDVNGETRQFSYIGIGNSVSQMVTLTGLSGTGTDNALISVYALSDGGINCTATADFNIPNGNCDVTEVEYFNFCTLPVDWSTTTSNTLDFNDNNYEWKFADGDRPIVNYAVASNASTTKTINGSCMAYFDDDVISDLQYTGNISLETKTFDFTGFQAVILDFKYIFNNLEIAKGPNNSRFYVEVFNGVSWIEIYSDDADSCPFHNVWASNCVTQKSLDLTTHMNPNLKIRFSYTDGNSGDWTGMIALDNVEVTAVRAAVLPLEIVDLRAAQLDNQIKLDWEVLDELNIDHYIVEKYDIENDMFEYLTEVKSKKSSKTSNYQIYDTEPLDGNNTYRLIPVSNENEKFSARVTSINFEQLAQFALSLYPNPVTADIVTLDLAGAKNVQTIDIRNATGQILQNITVRDNQSRYDLELSGLASGIYFISVDTGQHVKIKKLVRL